MNRYAKHTKHELNMALADRETSLSFALKWCNVLLIERVEEEIQEIKYYMSMNE